MSKPREPWWGYVKNVIRKYPEYKKQLRALKSQQITPGYSKTGGRGKTQRKTEAIALRELPPRDQHSMQGAAMVLHADYTTVLRWNRSFVYLVADNMKLT